MTQQTAKTIDVTPTWEALLPFYLGVILDGDPKACKVAKEELRRMALAADKWNEHCSNQKA